MAAVGWRRQPWQILFSICLLLSQAALIPSLFTFPTRLSVCNTPICFCSVTEELAKGIDAAARLAADSAVGTLRQQLLSASLQARGGSAAGAASGSSLLVHAVAEALAALPQLSDARDQEQVEGITRLAEVLQVGVGRCVGAAGAPAWAGEARERRPCRAQRTEGCREKSSGGDTAVLW